MAKRKRAEQANGATTAAESIALKKAKVVSKNSSQQRIPHHPLILQVVAGSYDRVLHGITVTIDVKDKAEFTDSFLFNAHTSAIRCLALSPISAQTTGQGQKVMLATGSTDERINVYNLSAHPPSRKNQELMANVGPRPILENSRNRELGTLLHHDSTVTKLIFPTRSKLLSSSEDSTIAVTRTRDWSLLSKIKAPIPKAQGRPSGDTAAFGGTPAGVNDFAIHPSMKLMISVSKGEKCMRLWNLVTGKKAGVLNFSREMLQDAGEGKHSTGEGRRVVWGSVEGEDEFAVGFERDVVVFGMDSVPKCRLMRDLRTKIHQFFYIKTEEDADLTLLALSTEDGRILFFSTSPKDLDTSSSEESKSSLPVAKLIAQLGGKADGISGRIKDFAFVQPDGVRSREVLVIGGSSDGKIRIWKLDIKELTADDGSVNGTRQVGKLLGSYETQNRITCLGAFVMIPRPAGVEESEDEDEGSDAEASEEEDSDE
jgi:protein MAK11